MAWVDGLPRTGNFVCWHDACIGEALADFELAKARGMHAEETEFIVIDNDMVAIWPYATCKASLKHVDPRRG